MKEKRKVLWIEDGARRDLPHLTAPVYMEGGYDLVVAEDASAGVRLLEQEEYDAIIVDIRLPPGDDPGWIRLYKRAGSDKVAARLGLQLLYAMLGSPRAEFHWEDRPAWITPDRIGVLTVEGQGELTSDLVELRIEAFRFQQKDAGAPDTVLLDLIRRVLGQAA